jgi:hypothetical protein
MSIDLCIISHSFPCDDSRVARSDRPSGSGENTSESLVVKENFGPPEMSPCSRRDPLPSPARRHARRAGCARWGERGVELSPVRPSLRWPANPRAFRHKRPVRRSRDPRIVGSKPGPEWHPAHRQRPFAGGGDGSGCEFPGFFGPLAAEPVAQDPCGDGVGPPHRVTSLNRWSCTWENLRSFSN